LKIDKDEKGNWIFFCCSNLEILYKEKKIKFYSNYTSYNHIFLKVQGLFGNWVYYDKGIENNEESMAWMFCPFCNFHFYNNIRYEEEVNTITKALSYTLRSLLWSSKNIAEHIKESDLNNFIGNLKKEDYLIENPERLEEKIKQTRKIIENNFFEV